MYLALATIMTVWLVSLYAFAKWRVRSKTQKGIHVATVLNDRPTKIYLQTTVVIVLILVIYIILLSSK